MKLSKSISALLVTAAFASAFSAERVDFVQPGDEADEKAHAIVQENSSPGKWSNRGFRQVPGPDGFFAYRMKCVPKAAVALTYWGRDGWDGRIFDLAVDETTIAHIDMPRIDKDEFHEVEYPIPAELTRGKKTIEVRITSTPDSRCAGGIFGVAVVKYVPPKPAPPRIKANYEGKATGWFMDPLMLKDEWTLAVQAKAMGNDNTLLFVHGTSQGRHGTGVFGVAAGENGHVEFFDGWSRANGRRTIATKFVSHRNDQMHLYVITRRKDGFAVFYVDGEFAGAVPGFGFEPNAGFLAFGGVHARGAGLGFAVTDKNQYGRIVVWDRVLEERDIEKLAERLPPEPAMPKEKEKISAALGREKLLRLGRELPPRVEISAKEDPSLVAKGVLAQCIYGLSQRLELGSGGKLELGELGLEFDSNYAHGKEGRIVFSGGTLSTYEKSHVSSLAPIRLVNGTVSKIVAKDKLVLRTAFEGGGDLVIAGKGRVAFSKSCPEATGTLKLAEGADVFFAPGAVWGGKIVRGQGVKLAGSPKAQTKDFPQPATAYNPKKLRMEKLGRGVCAWRLTNDTVRIGWRYKSSDPTNAAFNVYCDGKKVNSTPVANVTYFDHRFEWDGKDHRYEVAAAGTTSPRQQGFLLVGKSKLGYLDIELEPPAPRKTPDGQEYTYFPCDSSVGDLDGDGEYELVIAWWPTRHGDNWYWGQSGETILEGVKLDGTNKSLWRIDLGPNVRSGPHYNPFLVADFDGDGKAEVIVRTAQGAVDGLGRTLGWAGEAKDGPRGTNSYDFAAVRRELPRWTKGAKFKDFRPEDQFTAFAPNYVTCFAGPTGEALDTLPFKPDVLDDPEAIARRDFNAINWWYASRCPGNQSFRMLATTAYLDGAHPSAVMCRGYYSRTNLCAWDFDGKELKERWFFCSETERNFGYGGQGFHNIRAGDVDFDGKDEIIYGHMAVDHDGRGLWTSGYGHGDAMHIFQASPESRGLVNWTCHEHWPFGVSLIDCETGKTLLRRNGYNDTGSCNAMDIDPGTPGVELFAGGNLGNFSAKTCTQYPSPKAKPIINYYANLRGHILWKGDMSTSSYSGGSIIWEYFMFRRWVTELWNAGPEVDSVGGTKGNPNLICDIYGDWREELVLRRRDNRGVRVFFTPFDTEYRFWTLMEDPVYRDGVASQNSGYNVPTSPGFYFGPDLKGHGIWFRGAYLP